MKFYFYSTVIPLAITLIALFSYRPLNYYNITKSLTINLIPLLIYMAIIYFLEMKEYIDVGWVFYTLLFFLIFYILLLFGLWVFIKSGGSIK